MGGGGRRLEEPSGPDGSTTPVNRTRTGGRLSGNILLCLVIQGSRVLNPKSALLIGLAALVSWLGAAVGGMAAAESGQSCQSPSDDAAGAPASAARLFGRL